GVALISVDERGDNCIAVAPGANGRLGPEDVAGGGEGCAVGVAQLEGPQGAGGKAFRRARAVGAATLLNVAPAGEGRDAVWGGRGGGVRRPRERWRRRGRVRRRRCRGGWRSRRWWGRRKAAETATGRGGATTGRGGWPRAIEEGWPRARGARGRSRRMNGGAG